jgi:hypothetical protein
VARKKRPGKSGSREQVVRVELGKAFCGYLFS